MDKSKIMHTLRYHASWSKFIDLFPDNWFSKQLKDFQEDHNEEHFRYSSLLYLVDLYFSEKPPISLDDIITLVKNDEDQVMAMDSFARNLKKFCHNDILRINGALNEDIVELTRSFYERS